MKNLLLRSTSVSILLWVVLLSTTVKANKSAVDNVQEEETTTLLRGADLSLEESSPWEVQGTDASSRRELGLFDLFGDGSSGNLFLGITTTVCHRLQFGQQSPAVYETRSIWRILSAFHRRHGDSVGTCETECSGLCNHMPCVDDFTLSEDNTRCECSADPQDTCGDNTFCQISNDEEESCQCNAGFEGNPNSGCSDINECASDSTNNCGANTQCRNIAGSFTCVCLSGFTGDPVAGCTDINECNTASTCGPNGQCLNTVGAFSCDCDDGFVWNDPPTGICEDVDECLTADCGTNSVCTNTPGTFECSCAAGFNSTGTPPGDPCMDIDECAATDPPVCGANATCTNNQGSFACACDNGFEGDPPNCVPTGCTANGQLCAVAAECEETGGTFQCQCPVGFMGDPLVECTDVNECTQPNICDSTQVCFNIPGTFTCLTDEFEECPSGNDATCIPGFSCHDESASDDTLRCCENFRTCGDNNDNTCCNGAYQDGEVCPSTESEDCAGDLECGRTVLDFTFRCCDDTRPALNGDRICN